MTNTTISIDQRTIGEIAAQMPVAIRIFEAWKIDYCCGGKQRLADAVAAAGRSVQEFEAAVHGAATIPDSTNDWTDAPLRGVSTHIVDTFHRYTREELATFAPLSAKVLGVHGEQHPELGEVVALVGELTRDMLPHMLKEEQILFPYVAQLEDANATGAPAPVPFFGTVKNPVRMMMLEHDRVGELIARLRIVTGNYTAPASACFSYRELYRRLAEFELRTHEHIHIENNIYFPRAVSLEDHSGSPAEFGFSHACGNSSCA